MKLCSLIPFLFAASVQAQTACPGPTSTTWEWVGSDLVYTYYNATTWSPGGIRLGPMSQADYAVMMCPVADAESEQRATDELTAIVCQKPANPETLIPVFPEIVVTDSNAPTIADARQREWHRALMREKWGEPTIGFMDCLLDLWQWVLTQQNTPGRRTWWGNDVAQDGTASSRFGGLAGAESILDQDRQYEGTDL